MLWIRPFSAALIMNAIQAITALIEEGGRITTSGGKFYQAEQAAAWILSSNDDAPTDFLACCGVLDLKPKAVRDYIEHLRVKIESAMDQGGTIEDWERLSQEEFMRRWRAGRAGGTLTTAPKDGGEATPDFTPEEAKRINAYLGSIDQSYSWHKHRNQHAQV